MFLVVSDAGDLESRRVSWREARARCPYVFWKAKASLTRESVRVAQRQGGLCLVLVLSGIWGACSARGRAKIKRALQVLICRLDIHTSAQSGPARVPAGLVPLEKSREKTQTARWMAAPTSLPVCPCSIRINSCWALLTADGPSLAVTQRPAQRGLVGN